MAAIGVLTLELRLENSHSLKDKRHVVKSLKDRLRNKFNVSVAEIDYQDLWQRAVVAAVTVSPDHGARRDRCCSRWSTRRRRCWAQCLTGATWNGCEARGASMDVWTSIAPSAFPKRCGRS